MFHLNSNNNLIIIQKPNPNNNKKKNNMTNSSSSLSSFAAALNGITGNSSPYSRKTNGHGGSKTIPVSMSQTRSLRYQFGHQWQIHDYSYLNAASSRPVHISLTSMPFWHPDLPSVQFYLQLYPVGLDSTCSDHMSVFLFLKQSDNQQNVTASYKFCLIDSENHKRQTCSSGPIMFVPGGNGSGWNRFIPRNYCLDKANKLISDDQINIYCEVNIISTRYNMSLSFAKQSSMFSMRQWELLSNQQIVEDFGKLLDQSAKDFILVAGTEQKEIAVHKSVLTCRSPVFAAMLAHETVEKRDGRVVISDIASETVEQLVRYLYHGKADKYDHDLLVAADKYGTTILKMLCTKALCARISIENVIYNLTFADRYSVEELKEASMNFIIGNMSKLIDSEELKQLGTTHGFLLHQLFSRFYSNNKPKY